MISVIPNDSSCNSTSISIQMLGPARNARIKSTSYTEHFISSPSRENIKRDKNISCDRNEPKQTLAMSNANLIRRCQNWKQTWPLVNNLLECTQSKALLETPQIKHILPVSRNTLEAFYCLYILYHAHCAALFVHTVSRTLRYIVCKYCITHTALHCL